MVNKVKVLFPYSVKREKEGIIAVTHQLHVSTSFISEELKFINNKISSFIVHAHIITLHQIFYLPFY